MALERLDRTLWSYAEALKHVQTVTVARRSREAASQPPKPQVVYHYWNRPQDPAEVWKAEAENEFLVGLRDGDLLAQGRYTEERMHWRGHDGSVFGLHSGYHTSIRPEQWREGKYLMGRLTALNWEFIDIRMQRFMVKAIWPDVVPEAVRPDASVAAYTTPYLELMQTAIEHFGISTQNQGKKECLLDWFVETADRG